MLGGAAPRRVARKGPHPRSPLPPFCIMCLFVFMFDENPWLVDWLGFYFWKSNLLSGHSPAPPRSQNGRTSRWLHIHIYIYIYIRIHIHTNVIICIYVYIYIYIRMHIYIYIERERDWYTYIHVIYIYIYIHTHTVRPGCLPWVPGGESWCMWSDCHRRARLCEEARQQHQVLAHPACPQNVQS